MKEIKPDYTGLINDCITDPKQRLQVYSSDSVYLPTKKIGKNNPKAEEIRKDNEARTEWNQTADMALVSGLSQDTVIEVKKENISKEIMNSINENGKQPSLFRGIVLKAREILQKMINVLQVPAKPQRSPKYRELLKLEQVKKELDNQRSAIYYEEHISYPIWEQGFEECRGIFKGKERKAFEKKMQESKEKIHNMKNHMTVIVRRAGYDNVQEFISVYNHRLKQNKEYENALYNWNVKYGRDDSDIKSVLLKLKYLENGRGDKPQKVAKKVEKRQKFVR